MSESAFIRTIVRLTGLLIVAYAIINLPDGIRRAYLENFPRNVSLAFFLTISTSLISVVGGIAVYLSANKIPLPKVVKESAISSDQIDFIYNIILSITGLFILINGLGEILYYIIKLIYINSYLVSEESRTSLLQYASSKGTEIGGICAGILRIALGSVLFLSPIMVTATRAKVIGLFKRKTLRS